MLLTTLIDTDVLITKHNAYIVFTLLGDNIQSAYKRRLSARADLASFSCA